MFHLNYNQAAALIYCGGRLAGWLSLTEIKTSLIYHRREETTPDLSSSCVSPVTSSGLSTRQSDRQTDRQGDAFLAHRNVEGERIVLICLNMHCRVPQIKINRRFLNPLINTRQYYEGL